jgi:hypothetical protein
MSEKRFDVTGIGEIMLRYSVPMGSKFSRVIPAYPRYV